MAEEGKGELEEALKEFLSLYGVEIKPQEWEEARKEGQGIKEVVWKTQEKIDDLHDRADEILTKTGMTPEKMEAYASNRANFTPEQWKALQKVKEASENIKRRASQFLSQENLKKKVEKAKKSQKNRLGKKKHWIPL